MKNIRFCALLLLTSCGSLGERNSLSDSSDSAIPTIGVALGADLFQSNGKAIAGIGTIAQSNLRVTGLTFSYFGSLPVQRLEVVAVQDSEIKARAFFEFIGRTGDRATLSTENLHNGRVEFFFRSSDGRYDSDYGRNYPVILQK